MRAVFRIISVALLVAASSVAAEEIFPGYTWSEIAEGIYLHASTNPLAGPVDGNSVVIVADDEVYVADTHINPAAARAVVKKIQDMTDAPVTVVINTHWHDDHTNGNYVYRDAFPDASFVAHAATLASLREEWQAMEDGRREAYANVDPDALLATAGTQDDPARALMFRVYAGYVAALKPELPALELVYPDTVFQERLEYRRAGRRVVVEWLGRGNTDGDVVVHLPDDDLLITGDLLVAPIPFAFDSPMQDWVKTLERVRDIGAGTIVPGHGAVMHDNDYLEQVLALLETTLHKVRDAHERGVQYDDLADAVDLSEFEARLTGGDAEKAFAWQSYYLSPGLKSAWTSLGFPVPDSE